MDGWMGKLCMHGYWYGCRYGSGSVLVAGVVVVVVVLCYMNRKKGSRGVSRC